MLFEPLALRSLNLRNRIAVSPMCQYSAVNGAPNDWHLVHLGSRAVGGAGLVIAEATAVCAEGRISPGDAGLYEEAHIAAWAPITRFIAAQGAVPAVQLAHAGRKASVDAPWRGGASLDTAHGGWTPLAPSALAFSAQHATPLAMTAAQIAALPQQFAAAARRALAAGFRCVEIHAAHGYLLHQFLSPLSNRRSDDYGGSFEGRTRLLLETVQAVRAVWPDELPLLVRISATDWADVSDEADSADAGAAASWTVDQSVALARLLAPLGVDLVDVSSGGLLPQARMRLGPGYQSGFAASVRRGAGIRTSAVGAITTPEQAEQILLLGQADLVLLGRELLRDPYWPRRAAQALGVTIAAPPQYQRAW